MCAIVDTCSIGSVFNRKAQFHNEYAPLLSWIESAQGRIVFGGKKYLREIKDMEFFKRLLQDYARQGKLVRLDDAAVDKYASQAKAKIRTARFNDEHIVAMVAVSGCRVVCTDDDEAIPYYNRKVHKHLCGDDNVAPICRRKKRIV